MGVVAGNFKSRVAGRAAIMQSMTRPAPKLLALVPPMTQLNTPYPSTAYLTGFLRARGFDAHQEDLAIELALGLLSATGLAELRAAIEAVPARRRGPRSKAFLEAYGGYHAAIDGTVAFLQGRDPTLAHRIVSRQFLPEGPRFQSLEAYSDETDPLAWAFGALGNHDRARHLATLFINDLADVLREAVDPRFEFVRYAERLAASEIGRAHV